MKWILNILQALSSLSSLKKESNTASVDNLITKVTKVSPEGSTKPGEGISVVLDPGHGGNKGKPDPGAVGSIDGTPVYERDLVLAIASELALMLDELGFSVVMTRIDNKTISTLPDKVEIIKEQKPDIMISIHCNSSITPTSNGIETFYIKDRLKSKLLASKIQSSMMSSFPDHRDRGIKDGSGLYILRKQPVEASCLVECEFINNYKQAKFLKEEKTAIAKAILRGILDFLEVV